MSARSVWTQKELNVDLKLKEYKIYNNQCATLDLSKSLSITQFRQLERGWPKREGRGGKIYYPVCSQNAFHIHSFTEPKKVQKNLPIRKLQDCPGNDWQEGRVFGERTSLETQWVSGNNGLFRQRH